MDEKKLLNVLDEARKKEHLSRSQWFKNQIREKYINNKKEQYVLTT